MVQLGPFRLDAPIGHGGMGEIWSGIHGQQERPVAVKLLTVKSARDPRFLAAFRNEVRAAAALDHPHIVRVYDHGEVCPVAEQASAGRLQRGTPYLAMELVEGGTLHPLAGKLRWPILQPVLLALLDALAHAHARGVIHRDLKPGNVLVARRGVGVDVKLTDFGLAHAVDGHLAGAERPFYGGTPSYMAPEQFDGRWRDYGPWTDLYAFGCLAFTLVRGSPPFGPTTSYVDKQQKHMREPVPPLRPAVPVPAGFEGWVRRLLEKDPAQRFRRAADAAWALLELGPPEQAGVAPPELSSQADTLILGTWVALAEQERIGDATTLPLDPDETGEVGLPLTATQATVPPLPPDWRRPGEADAFIPENLPRVSVATGPDHAVMAGLGLWGLRSVPLVGREAERDRLWAMLDEVKRSGKAQFVVLSGPSGCGRSHLARWFCERAHEVGAATILRASHSAIPGPSHGLGPMVGSFLRCQGLARAEVHDRVERMLRTRGVSHADEWMALTEVIAPANRSEHGGIRFGSQLERYVTVRRLIQALAVERPVVLWLDDVHWGLDALRFVEHLLERQRNHPVPVLIIATATDELLAERRDEATLLAELLDREDAAARMNVEFLPPEPFRRLVQVQLGLDPDLARRVEARSGGNPLFAVQLVEDWVERDLLEAGPHGFRLRTDVDLPHDVRALWRSRVERVLAERSPAEERALELAAVLGSEVEPDEWLDVCSESPRPADPSEELLEALLDAGLAVTGAEGAAQGWSFAHGKLRECLEERAAEAGRLEELHRTCARVLAPRARSGGGAELAERLGRHLLASGDELHALQPLMDAARARYAVGDYAAGDALLDRREEAMASVGLPTSDARWGEGWLLRYELARGRADYEAAEHWLARAERSADVHGWRRVAGMALAHRGRRARVAGELERALTALASVEQLAEDLGDLELRARARWEIGSTLTEQADMQQAAQYARDALSDYEAVEDPIGCARAWQSLGEIAKESGRHGEAVVLLRQAEGLFEECGNRWGMASAVNSQGDIARYRDELEDAEALYRRARGLMRAIGSGAWIFPEFNLGLVALARGDARAARPGLERGLDTFVRQENRAALAAAHLALGACAGLEDQWLLWDEHMDQAAELLAQTTMVDEDNARTAARAGRIAAAKGQVERARQAYRMSRSQWVALRRTTELAEVDAALDALRQAASS